jgi:hypothetical protein
VLAAVEGEQHPPRRQRRGEGVNQRAAGFPEHANGGRHPRDDQPGLPQIAEFDQPHPVREVARDAGQDLQGQPRLANTAGTAERERPRAIKDVPQVA